MKRIGTCSTAGLAVLVSLSGGVHGQTYPERPIRFIIPFASGGTSDIVARLLGVRVGQDLGQTLVVDTRAGGGSTLGTALAAKAPPDGYTIILSHISLAINHSLYAKLPYDVTRDLAPITRVGDTPNAVVVSGSMTVRSVAELVAAARKQPGKLDYGSGGIGSAGHLPIALLEDMTGTRFNHIPYKGGGPSVVAVMADEVKFAMPSFPTAVPHVKQGRLRLIAVTGAERTPAAPDTPTVAESVPGFEFAIWYGIFAPAGTPPAIIARLNRAFTTSLKNADLQKQLTQQGVDVKVSTPEELGAKLVADVRKWERIIRAAGLKAE